jgi:hypothetical protein
VPAGDSPDTIEERHSNKLSNKPNAELQLVIDGWPQLPDAIRSAILAIVRTSIDEGRG